MPKTQFIIMKDDLDGVNNIILDEKIFDSESEAKTYLELEADLYANEDSEFTIYKIIPISYAVCTLITTVKYTTP